MLRLQDTFSCLERARMPVLAAVQGGCIGGAFGLATAADLRYCTADAFFVVQELNIGMTADVGTLQRLPRIVGEGVARELAFTGNRMPAGRAREVGLVNEVYDDAPQMLAAVLETARGIAGKSPLALWGSKETMNHARDHGVAAGLEQIATWQAGMFQPADVIESVTARGERREPSYDDLLTSPEGL